MYEFVRIPLRNGDSAGLQKALLAYNPSAHPTFKDWRHNRKGVVAKHTNCRSPVAHLVRAVLGLPQYAFQVINDRCFSLFLKA